MSKNEMNVRMAFRKQAGFCRALGSTVTADALEAAANSFDSDTMTGQRVLTWTGDPSSAADALALRVSGGLHALARSGKDPTLAAAYRGDGDIASEVSRALIEHDEALLPWLDNAPQTNETGRSAMVMAGLLVVAKRFSMPIELLELGASGGLVLNLQHYRYDLGGQKAGNPESPLLIQPEWKGAPPPEAKVDIVRARGVDLNPMNLTDDTTAERLAAYVWPDQHERLARTEAAIALARKYPPDIDKDDAASWAEARLAKPQEDGVLRILFHTVAFQYFPEEQKQRIRDAVAEAGEATTEARPLGWLSFENNEASRAFELILTLYPGGAPELLATAHPHVTNVEWLA